MIWYRDDENVQKVKDLEYAATHFAAADIPDECARLGDVKLSARALGLACRFRGVDCVRALVEGGANFKTPKDRQEEMLYHAYSIKKTDFNHSNYSIYLLNIDKKIEGSYCAKSMRFSTSVKVGKSRLVMLSDGERAKVLKYLCDNRQKCAFDPSELLFYSIFACDDLITGELKKLGIGLSDGRVKGLVEGGDEVDCYWREYRAMTDALEFEDFIVITERLFGELGGNKIRCTENFFNELRGALFDPKFAEFFFDKFNVNTLNKSKLLREMIDADNADFLPIAETAGWLADIKRRDSLIEYASKKEKTECTVWLLEFKNRTADLAAEREKAERKLERELNAAPDSVTALKALWSYGKLEDGTLMIKRYKGGQTEITVPEKIGKSTVTVIGKQAFSTAFRGLSKERTAFIETIKKVTLPNTIDMICEKAFYGCCGLEEIEIPDSVGMIEGSAFANCRKLRSVKLPNGLPELPHDLFSGCFELRRVIVPDSVKVIGNEAFSFCDLIEIELPNSVVTIKWGAFSHCESLEKIKLPSGLTAISSIAFYGCKKLKEITVPGGIKNIDTSAFNRCSELEEFVIPDGVIAVNRMAFANCQKLRSVVLPASIKVIGGVGDREYSIFHGSENVTAIVEKGSYAEKYCKLKNIRYEIKE